MRLIWYTRVLLTYLCRQRCIWEKGIDVVVTSVHTEGATAIISRLVMLNGNGIKIELAFFSQLARAKLPLAGHSVPLMLTSMLMRMMVMMVMLMMMLMMMVKMIHIHLIDIRIIHHIRRMYIHLNGPRPAAAEIRAVFLFHSSAFMLSLPFPSPFPSSRIKKGATGIKWSF